MSAPLPFMGQKRMFAKHFIEVIRQYPADRVFVHHSAILSPVAGERNSTRR